MTQESKFQKAFRRDVEWNREDLNDAIYWVRMALSLLIGVIWGMVPLTGFVGLISYVVAISAIVFVYYAKYLNVDDEQFGRMELLQEGFMPSFALFLVFWISFYSLPFESP